MPLVAGGLGVGEGRADGVVRRFRPGKAAGHEHVLDRRDETAEEIALAESVTAGVPDGHGQPALLTSISPQPKAFARPKPAASFAVKASGSATSTVPVNRPTPI